MFASCVAVRTGSYCKADAYQALLERQPYSSPFPGMTKYATAL